MVQEGARGKVRLSAVGRPLDDRVQRDPGAAYADDAVRRGRERDRLDGRSARHEVRIAEPGHSHRGSALPMPD